MKYLLIIFINFILFAEENENKINFKLSGNFRTRGFTLSRDIFLERQSPVKPIYSSDEEDQKNTNEDKINQEIENRKKGEPSTLTKKNEQINYFDTRLVLNLLISPSKYFELLWGIQVGDIVYGGKGYQVDQGSIYDPNVIGPNSGGQIGVSGVNLQTNFLYLDIKYPNTKTVARVGLQLFSSIRGRVMLSRGLGVNIIQEFSYFNTTLESGALRAQERVFVDKDGNGYTDQSYSSDNIFYTKLKFSFLNFINNELYGYYLDDSVREDKLKTVSSGEIILDSSTKQLFWIGYYNEFNLKMFKLILHGIVNQGIIKQKNPYFDSNGNLIYSKYDRHFINGALFDFEFAYEMNQNIKLSFIGVGSTGRSGYEKDGTKSDLKGRGYQNLYPAYGESNIAVDYYGGYALFSASSMSGMYLLGLKSSIIPYPTIEFNFGYYKLYSSKSPEISNNQNFNVDNHNKTSTNMGQEFNFNARWTIHPQFSLGMRSGYFIAGDGLKALFDTTNGKTIKELFFSIEYKF